MRRKGWMFWVLVGVIVVIALRLPAPLSRSLKQATRDLLAPVQGLIASYSNRLQAAGRAIRGWGGLPDRVQELERENVRLQHRVQEVETYARENVLLRRQLGFARRSPHHLVACEVLARDISGWWQTIRIGHEGDAALQKNQAVVTADGLVGRVLDVAARTCDVLLISDPACKVSVQIGESGAFGILTGQGLSWKGNVLCRMDLINKNLPVRTSDIVLTSGLGGVFPKGLLVGYVEEVRMDESGLYQVAMVRPKVDLGDLNVVFVVANGPEPTEDGL